MRVTFFEKEAAEKALKLDRELRINGFLVTITKFRDEEEQKAHAANSNKVTTTHSYYTSHSFITKLISSI